MTSRTSVQSVGEHMKTIEFKHTSFSLGFNVSKELLEDSVYPGKLWFEDRTGVSEIGIGVPPRRRYTPVDDWPPTPDDLNERWWE